MSSITSVSSELQQWSLLHFEKGVPICDINVRKENKDRLARVSHVFWQWKKDPWLDTKALFRQLVRGKFTDASSEWKAAQKDEALFKFVRDHVSPPSRAEATAKVRAVADRLMKNGMATDNGKDMAEGAKIAMKLDRLDQPESEQNDMNKVAFLPSVVVTDIREVDDTKQNYDDEQSNLIMKKYGAYIDEKRTMIEEKVAMMEAAAGTAEKDDSH
jgi:hypothetical protein